MGVQRVWNTRNAKNGETFRFYQDSLRFEKTLLEGVSMALEIECILQALTGFCFPTASAVYNCFLRPILLMRTTETRGCSAMKTGDDQKASRRHLQKPGSQRGLMRSFLLQ
jgi:hypothetical protein